MNKSILPKGWAPPPTYTHAYEVTNPGKTVYVSGQIGVAPDGSIAPDVAGQSRQAYANVKAVLAEAGLGIEHIVKATVFLVNPEDTVEFGKVRSEFLGSHKPASTLVIARQLAKPEWLVEIEVVACS